MLIQQLWARLQGKLLLLQEALDIHLALLHEVELLQAGRHAPSKAQL
jgi:hypothetical protein